MVEEDERVCGGGKAGKKAEMEERSLLEECVFQ